MKMKIYGIKREIYKNNGRMPYETIIDKEVYRTIEGATKAMLHKADQACLFYHYEPVLEQYQACFHTAIERQHNSKTGKDTIYRHEWHIIEFDMEY